MLKIATIPCPIATKYKSLFGQAEPIVKNPIWLNCFARGIDGRVYRKWFDNKAGWKPSDFDWQPLGGGLRITQWQWHGLAIDLIFLPAVSMALCITIMEVTTINL